MAKLTAGFDYTGKAPSDSFMQKLMDDSGYTNIEKQSTLTWIISTSDSKVNVAKNLATMIKNRGEYPNGTLTTVDVT